MQQAFDRAFDHALVFHGFTDYLRDYEMVIEMTAGPRSGLAAETFRYVFVNCVRAGVSTALPPGLWAKSVGDEFVDDESGAELDGYVWGVRWQALYPGFEFVSPSEQARHWSESTGIPFHEVVVGANGHEIGLVFSDLRVEKVSPGYAPFAVAPEA